MRRKAGAKVFVGLNPAERESGRMQKHPAANSHAALDPNQIEVND
jgi:hypothetical protein